MQDRLFITFTSTLWAAENSAGPQAKSTKVSTNAADTFYIYGKIIIDSPFFIFHIVCSGRYERGQTKCSSVTDATATGFSSSFSFSFSQAITDAATRITAAAVIRTTAAAAVTDS